ncbi:MAG: hypothetical protein V1892_03630 [bacterium]
MEIILTDERDDEVKKKIWFCDKCGKIFRNGGDELTKAEIAILKKEFCQAGGCHSIIYREVSVNQKIAL